MSLAMKETLKEQAYADCIKYECPDVEIIRDWPREKKCVCGFKGVPDRTDGKAGYYLSCPDCGSVVDLKEIDND